MHLLLVFAMVSSLLPLIFHILCDDLAYKLEIFCPIIPFIQYVSGCEHFLKKLSEHDDYLMNVITASNRTLFVGDYVTPTNDNKELTSFPSLVTNNEVHMKHVKAVFSPYRNCMVVSQRVTNLITAKKLYESDKNDF